jgi:sulfoacetaldehyde acetyltransferase
MNTMTDARNLDSGTGRAAGRQRMSAPAAFVETLIAHHVKNVFGITGAQLPGVVDFLAGAGIRLVTAARSETAAQMADGYGRVGECPAVCIVPEDAGNQLVAAVASAYWARTPLVVVTLESGSPVEGQALTKVTSWQGRASSPLQIADLLRRAFTVAVHERAPVQVSLGDDSFRGDGEYEIGRPLAIERAAGGARSLAKAAQLLAHARFPVIVAGEGVAGGVEEVKALAERLTAPVVSPYRRNDSFPASHPLACGPLGPYGSRAAMQIVSRADVVLALGTRLGARGALPVQEGEGWREDAKIIQIDSDDRALGMAGEVALAIHGDARLAAQDLLRHFKGRTARKPDKARLAEVQREKEAWMAALASQPSAHRKGQIGARRALAQLAKALPRNAMVATDVGHMCSMLHGYLGFEQPASFLAAMGEAARGCAYPTVLGARLAQPDRPAIACLGDGAWALSVAQLATALKERIPGIAVVLNNGQTGGEKRESLDLSEDARALGAEGYCAEYEDEVGDALKAALRSGKPAVVEIRVTPERGELFGRESPRKSRRPAPAQRGTVTAQ